MFTESIEFAPILTICLFEVFTELRTKKIVQIAVVSVVVCFSINFIKIEERLPDYFDNLPLRFYAGEHYVTPYKKDQIRIAFKQIPEDAKVSAEFNLVPHLSDRRVIFQYPKVRNADYIILCPGDEKYTPLKKEEYEMRLKKLLDSKEWEVLIKNDDVILFMRNWDLLPIDEVKKIEEQLKKNETQMIGIRAQAKSYKSVEEILWENALFIYDKNNAFNKKE